MNIYHVGCLEQKKKESQSILTVMAKTFVEKLIALFYRKNFAISSMSFLSLELFSDLPISVKCEDVVELSIKTYQTK